MARSPTTVQPLLSGKVAGTAGWWRKRSSSAAKPTMDAKRSSGRFAIAFRQMAPMSGSRPGARQHLIEQHAEAVDVAAGAELVHLAAHLLGGHVGRRAEYLAG